MKIATYNLNGIRSAISKDWISWIKKTDFDVICVQELKAQADQLDLSVFEDAGYNTYLHCAEKKGYSGVGIFCKQKPDYIEYGCGNPKFDKEGRVIRADFGEISVFSIYFPSGTTGDIRQSVKYVFLDFILDYLKQIKKKRKKLIVCGDYNIANNAIDIHDPIGNKNSSGFLLEERTWLDTFWETGFIDSLRHFNKEPHQYTWWSFRANARANNKGWRIDYIAITENLVAQLKSAVIMSDAMHSDHCPMMIEIE
ncbi:MAG: exodeoxyribonuclease III [Chitinophagales bacterium]|nr:exodeoxyribonuclease III [Chitinophagales bacterium]MBP8754533.1 exodeoxyribonuclease III [Chitinophagales bacterium]MBP9795027.1 exodeoxyribonuclease III [Chitinophagales bacterium]